MVSFLFLPPRLLWVCQVWLKVCRFSFPLIQVIMLPQWSSALTRLSRCVEVRSGVSTFAYSRQLRSALRYFIFVSCYLTIFMSRLIYRVWSQIVTASCCFCLAAKFTTSINLTNEVSAFSKCLSQTLLSFFIVPSILVMLSINSWLSGVFRASSSLACRLASKSSLILSTFDFYSMQVRKLPKHTLILCQNSLEGSLDMQGLWLGISSFEIVLMLCFIPLFLIFLASVLYFRVFRVSSQNFLSADTQAIMTVLEFPPRDSLRILVSLDSLKGTQLFLLSANMLRHLPSVSRLLLIFTPSIKRLDSLVEVFSLPARSIIKNLDSDTCACPLAQEQYLRMLNCRIACDRLETQLDLVAFMALFSMPAIITSLVWVRSSTDTSVKPPKKTPLTGSSIILTWRASSCSRSLILSLYISQKETSIWVLMVGSF